MFPGRVSKFQRQETHCMCDTHQKFLFKIILYTFNFFSGTSTVEMLFGQLMLMIDGCGKFDARQLEDILKRLTLTSALRFLPYKVRGFSFLTHLKRHMASYKPDDFVADESLPSKYPVLSYSKGSFKPVDSPFDKPTNVKKKKARELRTKLPDDDQGHVRKYHKKF